MTYLSFVEAMFKRTQQATEAMRDPNSSRQVRRAALRHIAKRAAAKTGRRRDWRVVLLPA